MNIEEVKDILGICRMLRAPKHIFITNEPVYEQHDGRSYFRGLQPVEMRDIIFLSKQADITTVGHEAWHAQTGLGELTAYPFGRLLAAKYRIISNFPILKAMGSNKVEYAESTDSSEFPQARKYRGRVEHYVRVS